MTRHRIGGLSRPLRPEAPGCCGPAAMTILAVALTAGPARSSPGLAV